MTTLSSIKKNQNIVNKTTGIALTVAIITGTLKSMNRFSNTDVNLIVSRALNYLSKK